MYPKAMQISGGVLRPVEGAPVDAFGRTTSGAQGLPAPTPSVPGSNSALGTGPTVALTAGRVSTDALGWVDCTVGSTPQAGGGNLFTLTFANPFNGIPGVDILGADGANVAPTTLYVSSYTIVAGQVTAVTFACTTQLTATQVLRFQYTVTAPAP